MAKLGASQPPAGARRLRAWKLMITKGFYIALFVFLLSFTGAVFSLREIFKLEAPQGRPLSALPFGKHHYFLQSEGRCTGSFDYSLGLATDRYELTLQGNLRASLGSRVVEPKFRVEAVFNKIGQMGASVSRLTFDQGEVVVGTIGINVLDITVKSTQLLNGGEWNTTFPGPIELRRNADGTFRVEHQMLRALPVSPGIFDQPAFRQFQLQIVAAGDATPECVADSKSAMVLDRFVALASVLQTYFKRLPTTPPIPNTTTQSP